MTLRSVYEDPRTTTRDPVLLAKRAGTTVKSAKAFLADEASAQTAEQWRRPSSHAAYTAYAPTGAPEGHWQADVIFFDDYRGVNDKRKAILTMLNTTSRFALARPLLNAKAGTVAAAMKDILDELARLRKKVTVLRVDGGGEFRGAFGQLMRERGITIDNIEPFTHYRLARTDRWHRTLRKRIGEHFEREQTHRWIDVLPDIVANMNATPHRTLTELLGEQTAPEDVTLADERKIRAAEGRRAREVREATDMIGIVPGETQVRLLVRQTKAALKDGFAKSQRAVWTPETYTVLERNGPNSWVVDVPGNEVKIFPSWALKVVDMERLQSGPRQTQGEKVDVAVERAKRMEARNISEEDQAAAIAAPARPRRERAVRRDYAAMARGGGRVYTLYL